MRNITRRSAVSALVGAAGLSAIPVAASAAAPDPIFAAIERHKAAYAAHIAEVEAEVEPQDRWLEASANAEIVAAWALVAEPPTTLSGAAALTAYALEYKLSDLSWPNNNYDSSDDYAAALLRSLNNTLGAEAVS